MFLLLIRQDSYRNQDGSSTETRPTGVSELDLVSLLSNFRQLGKVNLDPDLTPFRQKPDVWQATRNGRKADTYPFLSGEKAETQAEAGTRLTGQLTDILDFLNYGRWKA